MRSITGLAVDRHVTVVSVVEAWATSEMFLHRRRGPTSHICVSANGRAVGSGGKVMVEGVTARAVTRARMVRRARGDAAMRGNGVVLAGGWLPINGVEALIELLGAGELPFTEDGPEDSNTSNRSRHSDNDG
jgi:hypothetical protein